MSAPSPDQPTIRFIDVDGIRLRTSVRSCGPPLLLVTGLGASLELAEPFEQELTARGVQTVAFDAPGIGESTAYTLPRRMPGIARTIEAMLDALGYDRVDVLGVSLGGVVAQQFAHQAPRRVRRLVLAATGPGLGGVPGSPRVLLALATPRRYYQPDYYRRIAGRVYGGQARRDPDPLLHGSPARFVQRPSVRGYLGQLYAIAGWTSLLWLHRPRQPTLVLAGDDDPIVPLLNGRILARRPPAHCAWRWAPAPPRAAGGDGSAGHWVPGGATVNADRRRHDIARSGRMRLSVCPGCGGLEPCRAPQGPSDGRTEAQNLAPLRSRSERLEVSQTSA